MQTYTDSMLRLAWIQGCLEIAAGIQTRVWEYAKYNPGSFEFEEKIFIHKTMANKIHENLKISFPGVEVTMNYQPEDNEQGMAKYRFDWS